MNIIPSRIAYTMDTTIYLSNTFLLYFNINNGINIKNKNYMMLIASIVAIALQLAVIEIPFMREVFSTSDLTVTEWLITAAMCVTPLIVHEIVVLIKFIIKKTKKN